MIKNAYEKIEITRRRKTGKRRAIRTCFSV